MLFCLDIATAARFCQRVNTKRRPDRARGVITYVTHVLTKFLVCRNLCVKGIQMIWYLPGQAVVSG